MRGDVLLMVDEFVVDGLLGVSSSRTQLRHTIDDIVHQMETIEIVDYAHVEWRCRRAFFLVAPYVNVVMVRPPVRQPVNEPRIAMKCEDDRFVLREERVKILIAEAAWVLTFRL